MNTSRPKTAAADQDPATAGALDVLIQSAPPHPALLGLDARQRLVLAQLVYQSHQQQPSGTGKINWQDVSHQLASHPVFASQTEEGKIPSVTLDATQCQLAWTVLMLERGLVDKSSSASTTTPMKDSRAQLALAQLLYVERVQDLEKTITSRENRYRELVAQMDLLRADQAGETLLDTTAAKIQAQEAVKAATTGDKELTTDPPPPPATASTTTTAPTSPASPTRVRRERNASTTDTRAAALKSPGVKAAGNSTTKAVEAIAEQPEEAVNEQKQENPVAEKAKEEVKALAAEGAFKTKEEAKTAAAAAAAKAKEEARAEATEATLKSKEEAKAVAATAPIKGTKEAEATNAAVAKAKEESKKQASVVQQDDDDDDELTEEEDMEPAKAAAAASKAKKAQAQAQAPADASEAGEEEEDEKADGKGAKTTGTKGRTASRRQTLTRESSEAPDDEVRPLSKRSRRGEPEKDQSESRTATPDVAIEESATRSARGAAGVAAKRKRDVMEKDAGKGETPLGSRRGSGATDEKDGVTPRGKRMRSRSSVQIEDTPAGTMGGGAGRGGARRTTRSRAGTHAEDDDESRDAGSTTAAGREASESAELTEEEDGDTLMREPEVDGEKTEEEGEEKAMARRGRPPKNRKPSATGSATNAAADEEDEKTKKANINVLLMLINEVGNHTHGNLFNVPIREADAPDYYRLIRHPTDLKTIRAKVKDGSIRTPAQLKRALNMMFANSLIYNKPGTEVHRMASEMRQYAEEAIERFEQTQRDGKWL